MGVLYPTRPFYQEEPSQTNEVIQEERSEVNLSQIEDQLEDAQPDSEDEAPVFLDLSGFKTGKELDVRSPMYVHIVYELEGFRLISTCHALSFRERLAQAWTVLYYLQWTHRNGGLKWSEYCPPLEYIIDKTTE